MFKKLLFLTIISSMFISTFGGILSNDKPEELDVIPKLEPEKGMAWVVIIRARDKRSNTWKMDVFYDKKIIVDAPDNSITFAKLPATGKETPFMVNGAEGEEEYMNITLNEGKIYFVRLTFKNMHRTEDIQLALLSPDEVVELLNESDKVEKMLFQYPTKNPKEIKERRWENWVDNYEKWIEDSEDDVAKSRAYKGYDSMFEYDFKK